MFLSMLLNFLYIICVFQASFRDLVGKGYQTLQSLLLEYCHSQASECLLNSLLDMLVDGKFDIKGSPSIKVPILILLLFCWCMVHLFEENLYYSV